MKHYSGFLKKRSVKYRIMLVMAVICLFPFLGILIYTIHNSADTLYKQALTREVEYLDKTMMQLNAYKESAESYFTSGAVGDVFFQYCYNELDYRHFSSLKNAQDELENFSYGQEVLGNAYFINFEYSYIIGSGFAGHYIQDSNSANPILEHLRRLEAEYTPKTWTYIPCWNGFLRGKKYPNLTLDGICLLIPYPLFTADSSSALVVQMDRDKLGKFLARDDVSGGNLFIINEEDQIIYSSSDTYRDCSLSEFAFFSSINREKKQGIHQVLHQDAPFYLTWIQDDSGWLYVSLNPANEMEQEITSLWITSLLLGGIAILFLLALVLFFARWLYHPIDNIANRIRMQGGAEEEDQDEFQLIDRGVSRYEERMEIYQNSLLEFFLQKLLKGSLSPIRIEEEVLQTGLPMPPREMAILVLQFLDISGDTPGVNVPAVQKVFSTISLECFVTSTHYKGLFVIWMQNTNCSDFSGHVREECARLQQKMAFEPYMFGVGASDIFCDYTSVQAAYLTAVSHLAGQSDTDSLISESREFRQKTQLFPEELCYQLASAIQNGSSQDLEPLLSSLAKSIFSKDSEPKKLELALICSVSSILSYFRKDAVIPQDSLPDHLLETLAQIHDARTMKYYFNKELIQPLEKWIQSQNNDDPQDFSRQVIQMIQEEFDTDITLEQCASRLRCHPVYLLQLFKEQTNQTFSQYLENYRFFMAKKWLLETAKPIAEIAELLRYSNAQNFIRSFKKKTGMTPGKYREENRC